MASDLGGPSKGLLGIFGVLLFGSSIASVVLGAITLLRYINVPYDFGQFSLYAASIALITIGGLLLITLIVGVIGALNDNENLRLVTLVLVFLLFSALAVIGAWSMTLVKTNRLQRGIDEDIDYSNKMYANNSDAQKKRVDDLNAQYNCCGRNNYTDFQVGSLPASCCKTKDCDPKNVESIHQKGCSSSNYPSEKVEKVFRMSIISLACAGAVLFGLILYGVLMKHTRGYVAVNH
ncbi:unnamed protein product [Didymodactylos carnosus]|uniref:Tetraspanin n=1 Tax=Didymodactylos carnosus TaxID=1234261 RepID=A0A814WNM0_9BILA|nr:unnamed protein product [Didymodactylos carnosus]CAF1212976.1 unnamed protein product [Didymodactylos carnosus]CAF3972197.1 unnamed protein product [Didymodactylos carnosus]CAF4021857.1 unnamed protein product [Didymodactylos carnosus]